MRVVETACPFCAAAISLDQTARPMPTQRLGRAATFAFGAALATGALGCGTSTTPGTDANVGMFDAAYGGPPLDAGTDGGLVAAYGGPMIDAGSDGGNVGPAYGAPSDAGEDSGNIALYGAPPAPPEP